MILKVIRRRKRGRRPDEPWIIRGVPGRLFVGPYKTREEAEADARGMVRFYKRERQHAIFEK